MVKYVNMMFSPENRTTFVIKTNSGSWSTEEVFLNQINEGGEWFW